MKKFKYPALVRTEAKNLRKFTTKEEKENLDYNRLNPRNEMSCIYGLLTNNCFSERAEELIVKSCPRVYKYDSDGFSTPVKLSSTLNGKPKIGIRYLNDIEEKRDLKSSFWSAIEVFIWNKKNQDSGANERLLKYIKGEIRTL
jgi:hypothetical protein